MKRLFQLVALLLGVLLTPLPALAQSLCQTCAPGTMACCRHPQPETDCGAMQEHPDAVCSQPCCAGSQPLAAVPQPAVVPPAAALAATAASAPSPYPALGSPEPSLPGRLAAPPQPRTARYVLYRDLRL